VYCTCGEQEEEAEGSDSDLIEYVGTEKIMTFSNIVFVFSI